MATTPDLEALETLKRIEKLLKTSSATSRETVSQRLAAKRLPGGAAGQDRDAQEFNKAIRATAASSRRLTAASNDLTASFGGLNSEIKKAVSSIGALTAGLTSALAALNKPQTIQPVAQSATVAPSPVQNRNANQPIPAVVPGALQKTPVLSTIGNFVRGLSTSTVGLYSLSEVLGKLWQVTTNVTRDFFHLSKMGLGSAENLGTLYWSAAKAGMSLSEYTKVLNDNISLTARAGSFDNFAKLTEAADKQLAQLGVFGEDARNLQATLLNTATLAGIPQRNFGEALKQQVEVFDRLRKSTNMTAQEFADLVTTVSSSDQAQKELLGLAPQERLARQSQLVEIAATGRQLGLNAEASKRLTDALIAQRGETVKKRFESAGRIRQLAALTGQSELGEEAAQIGMKGRRASSEEQKRLRQILGQLDQSSQSLYETQGFGVQNVLDQFDEVMAGSGFKQIMEANRPAQLAEQSATVFNKDFGKHVGEFGQFVGNMLTWAQGLSKSPIEPLSGVALGAIAALFGKALINPLMGLISKVFPSVGAKLFAGGAGTAAAGAGPISQAGAAAVSWVKNLGTTLKALPTTALAATSSGFSTLTGTLQGLATSARGLMVGNPLSNIASAFKNAIPAIRTGVSGIASSLASGLTAAGPIFKSVLKSSGLASIVFDSLGELFTGTITSAFTTDGGGIVDRIQGVIFSAVRSIPTMITGAIDYIFGTNLTNTVDKILAMAKAGLSLMTSGIVGFVVDQFAKLPFAKDSSLFKDLAAYHKKQEADLAATFETIRTLNEDETSTLSSIGEKKKQLFDAQAKEATKAETRAVQATSSFNSTMMNGAITAESLIRDADAIRASQSLAMPAQQRVTGINAEIPPRAESVNTNTEQSAQPSTNQTGQVTLSDLLEALIKLLNSSERTVEAEKRQIELFEQLISNSRTSRTFTSSESLNTMLLRS